MPQLSAVFKFLNINIKIIFINNMVKVPANLYINFKEKIDRDTDN